MNAKKTSSQRFKSKPSPLMNSALKCSADVRSKPFPGFVFVRFSRLKSHLERSDRCTSERKAVTREVDGSQSAEEEDRSGGDLVSD